MKKALIIIRNFLILNALVLIPFVGLVLWHHPEQLFLFIETPSPLSIGIGTMVPSGDGGAEPLFSRSVGCAVGVSGVPSAQVFMAQPNDASHFCYRFTGEKGSFTIRHAILIRHLFVRQDLSGDGFYLNYVGVDGVNLSRDGQGGCVVSKGEDVGLMLPKGDVAWSRTRLTFDLLTPNMRMCLWGFEFGILLLSFLGTLLKKKHSIRANFGLSALLAAICGAVVFFVLPLQTYLSNQSLFPCSTGNVVSSGAIYAVILFCLSFLMFFGSSFVLDRLAMALFVGVLVFEYLQTGILSASYPSMNGDILFYRNSIGLIVRDYVLLLVLTVLPLVGYRYIKDCLHWIALAVFVLFATSLFDVRPSQGETCADIKTTWTNSVDEVFASARFSPKRNVVVLIPDTVQGDVAVEVIKHDPEIAKKFSGFLAFVNNIGMHEFTIFGLPGLLTGKYYDGRSLLDDYIVAATTDGSFVADYDLYNWPCYVYAHFGLGMFTNRLKDQSKCKQEKVCVCDAFLVRQKGTPYLNLFDILTFRLAPFGMKERVNAKNVIGLGTAHDFFLESALYPMVGRIPINDSFDGTLHVYHSNGLHTPIMFDRNGNQTSCAQTYEAMLEQAYFVMSSIGKLCDVLRKRNLYDQTLIVVAADHGSGVSDGCVMGGDSFPGRIIPILWVKPFGADGEIQLCNVPTSHSKLRDLIDISREKDLSSKEIADVLKSDSRLWRRFRPGEITDYVIDAMGKALIRRLAAKEK